MPQRNTYRVVFTPLAAILFLFAIPVSALEPVTALDDGFALPSAGTMTEAALSWPGSEAFAAGSFALLAWTAPFGVRDLAVTTAAAGSRIGNAGVFLSYSGTGFDLYSDDTEKIGVSWALSRRLAAGARLTRTALRIEGYGNAAAWSADAGVVFRPSDAVALAVSVEDLAGAELGSSREPVDGRSRVGASWRIPGSFTLLASVTKVRRFDPSLSAGVLAEITPSFTAGVLGAGEPDRIEFLAALDLQRLRFSYRGSFHRDLGFTHGFSLGWGGTAAYREERPPAAPASP